MHFSFKIGIPNVREIFENFINATILLFPYHNLVQFIDSKYNYGINLLPIYD